MPMRVKDRSIKSKDTGFQIKNLDAGRSHRPLMCQQVQLWSVGHATVLVKDMISISCCSCCSPGSDRHQLYVIILMFCNVLLYIRHTNLGQGHDQHILLLLLFATLNSDINYMEILFHQDAILLPLLIRIHRIGSNLAFCLIFLAKRFLVISRVKETG